MPRSVSHRMVRTFSFIVEASKKFRGLRRVPTLRDLFEWGSRVHRFGHVRPREWEEEVGSGNDHGIENNAVAGGKQWVLTLQVSLLFLLFIALLFFSFSIPEDDHYYYF